MKKDSFIYAVARVRVKELALLGESHIEALLACKDAEACLQFLREKGWGSAEDLSLEEFFNLEYEKTWDFVKEVLQDYQPIRILLMENTFHNLKTIIKQVYRKQDTLSNLLEPSLVEIKILEMAVKTQNFNLLPKWMKTAAKEAYDIQFHTGDSRLCDAVLDQSTLENMLQEGKNSEDKFLQAYGAIKVDLSDIRIAIKGAHTGEKRAFLERAFATSIHLKKESLIEATLGGKESLYAYLQETPYGESVEMLRESFSSFEKWCNKQLMAFIRPQKTNPFTLGPVVAYVLARENEINAVKFLVLAKQYKVKEQFIREKLGEMYV